MDYNFPEVEKKWRDEWVKRKTYKVDIDQSKPKHYVLDMFPYPSGSGLHVGHPLGYIASDIYARFKRLNGFNVLHPMGYDSFGLPAEQYAIQTGQHPAKTTETNIARYREQLDRIGFSFDWSREIRTAGHKYYKWTQWIFSLLFKSWYNNESKKAESIDLLIAVFSKEGNATVKAANDCEIEFTAVEWNAFDETKKSEILLMYRLAFLSDTMVNWCPKLGTVLANDEIKEGVSERGGHPVERKLMRQWSLRITAYADRLLSGLDTIDWTDSLKETQRNWIGKSKGASVKFDVKDSNHHLEVFTTRPDTIFGVSFMVIAPEHEFVNDLTSSEQKEEVEAYVIKAKNRSERERMSDVKTVTGVFSGSYAIHPFTKESIPVWIGDYVLASYGTGAVMAVPAHDSRDYAFAKKFNLEIPQVIEGGNVAEEAYEAKSGKMINSGFLNGLKVKEAINKAIGAIMDGGFGKSKINFRLRDAVFSRQRYWGEPFPICYKNEIPELVDVNKMPPLPEVDKYLPTETGEPPLARAVNWKDSDGNRYEYNTMPGWAGSSWYFLRYMDPHNENEFVSQEAVSYWNQVDLYIGGSEHAAGHLLYSRFWTKFLYDLGYVPFEEPFKKLINQGMILGTSELAHKCLGINTEGNGTKSVVVDSTDLGLTTIVFPSDVEDIYVSKTLNLKQKEDGSIEGVFSSKVNVNFVYSGELNVNDLTANDLVFKNSTFVVKDGYYHKGKVYNFSGEQVESLSEPFVMTHQEVEKMSKSFYNTVDPSHIIEKHGADTLRLYEMFLGPLEQYKPWSTKGIEGVSKFIRKMWNLFHDKDGNWNVSKEKASKEELKSLHKTIKKVGEDVNNFSFNTSVSAFMVCVNELQTLKCNKEEILKELIVILHPYAPFVTEELWELLGNKTSILEATFPKFDPSVLIESNHTYPVSFNGKMRFDISLPIDMSKDEVEKIVLAHENSVKWLNGKAPKKVIVVPKRIVNIVV